MQIVMGEPAPASVRVAKAARVTRSFTFVLATLLFVGSLAVGWAVSRRGWCLTAVAEHSSNLSASTSGCSLDHDIDTWIGASALFGILSAALVLSMWGISRMLEGVAEILAPSPE